MLKISAQTMGGYLLNLLKDTHRYHYTAPTRSPEQAQKQLLKFDSTATSFFDHYYRSDALADFRLMIVPTTSNLPPNASGVRATFAQHRPRA